ncbi:Dehydrogenase/reductase SDR family member 12 [Collichthys lucidus]|uniref:Dehydrogenase/reductase SDR family member 12 n=1 Tax=Collichthys lucidus TaxID=240159 RepID=A0A4U5U149_COLLU|nr:Dehydrogenase/reductase SDR family member 12 [Collichthys lucidus]
MDGCTVLLCDPNRSGFEAAAKHFAPADLDVNLSGRSFVITGANSGIGKATAQEIANRGGTVHMVCRNKGRAEAARDEIVERSKNEINNAGCMVNQRELTDEGLEKNFATNTLGTYILTTALIPALKKAEDSRVVTVSSGGMLTQKLNVDDLQFEKGTFDGTAAYAQNKRQQVILTERWASQHKDIHFSSMHPGWADTPAVQTSMPSFHAKMQSKLRTEAMGADTAVWLAVSAAATKQPSGLFFQDRKAVATHLPLASSRSTSQEEEKLLTALEEFTLKFKP